MQSFLKKAKQSQWYGVGLLALIALAIWAVFKVGAPATFGAPDKLMSYLQSALIYAIGGCGMYFICVMGLFDFSIGSILIAAELAAIALIPTLGWFSVIVVPVVVGVILGLTNGIAYRRWLCQSNPKLASLLDETIGPDYRKDARKLEEFAKFASDSSVRKRVEEIKRENKAAFSDRLKAETGICPDPDSLFITQAKRLHEYKRQLLNALRIISRYNMLRENPNLDIRPETYLFAAKSAPNYYLAKNIIQLICRIGEEIEKDPKIRQKMRVIFLENYSVSMAERLMPASDISEQISLAGKEASGTGNMKLMINGAITIGTLDGANVEMREAVGDDAIFIFGQKADEVQKNLAAGYRSLDIYESNPAVKAAVDRLGEGFAGTDFHKLKDYLLRPTYSIADPYMCLKDFDDYCRVHQEIQDAYEDRDRWNSMSIRNIAMAARFAADRSIRDYAREIWHTKPISE